MNDLARPFPQPPAQIEPYFRVLGPELTLAFLLSFGGSDIWFSNNPRETGELAALVGVDRARALGEEFGTGFKLRVPLAKPWIAAVLAWQGLSNRTIARRLHASDVTVRGWLTAESRRERRAG